MGMSIATRRNDFDQPLGLMCDCHRKIEHHLEVICVIAETVAGGALSASHRHAMEKSLEYFVNRAPRHRADEEDSLFPRLMVNGDRRAKELQAMIRELLADHVESDKHHAVVNTLLRKWLDEGTLGAEDVAALQAGLAWLSAMYTKHISLEGACVFRTAGDCLEREELTQIGKEMATRRGVKKAAECADF